MANHRLTPVLIVALAYHSVSTAGTQCWVNWSCSSSQCSSVMGASSGRSGPFDSASACESWRSSYNSNSSCSCAEDSSSAAAGSSGSALSGALSSGMQGLTPQQTLGLGIGALGVNMILQGLRGNPEQQAAARAAEEQKAAELKRQQDQRRQQREQQDEAMKQELLHSLKGINSSTESMPAEAAGDGTALTLKLLKPAKIHDGFTLPQPDPYPP